MFIENIVLLEMINTENYICVHLEKVSLLLEIPRLESETNVQSFFGLVQFF